VFKKYNRVYYGFNIHQSEYIYNSLKQRDFFHEKYTLKTLDFNNIIINYDKQIANLNYKSTLKDSIIAKKDTIILNKDQEYIDKEKE
jgi:hypothetical protein